MSKNRKERRANKPNVDTTFEELFSELEAKTEQMNSEAAELDETPENDNTEITEEKVSWFDKVWNNIPKPAQTAAKIIGVAGVVVIGGIVIVAAAGAIAAATSKKENDIPNDGTTEDYGDGTFTGEDSGFNVTEF